MPVSPALPEPAAPPDMALLRCPVCDEFFFADDRSLIDIHVCPGCGTDIRGMAMRFSPDPRLEVLAGSLDKKTGIALPAGNIETRVCHTCNGVFVSDPQVHEDGVCPICGRTTKSGQPQGIAPTLAELVENLPASPLPPADGEIDFRVCHACGHGFLADNRMYMDIDRCPKCKVQLSPAPRPDGGLYLDAILAGIPVFPALPGDSDAITICPVCHATYVDTVIDFCTACGCSFTPKTIEPDNWIEDAVAGIPAGVSDPGGMDYTGIEMRFCRVCNKQYMADDRVLADVNICPHCCADQGV